MSCEKCDKYVDGYLQNTLSEAERDEYENHLKGCDFCQDEVAAFRRTEKFLDSVALPSMSDTFWRKQRMSVAKAIRPEPVWQAPALSLVAFAAVLAGYLYAGLDWLVISAGDFLGLTSANGQAMPSYSFDAYDTVILLYLGLFSLALMVFLSDSDQERRVSHRRNR